MGTKKDVLTFRVERMCQFQGTLYKATDDCKRDEVGLFEFPASLIYDVPQHFRAVEAGRLPPDDDGYRALIEMGPDDETNALRDAYFAVVLPILQDPNRPEADRHAEAGRIKANFLEFGQAEDPAGAQEPVPPAPTAAELEAERLRQENEELKARLAAAESKGGKAKTVTPEAPAPAAGSGAPASAPAPGGQE